MSMDIKSKTERADLTATLVGWIEDVETSKESVDEIALELYKNYNSIRSKRWYNGDSDIFVPFSFMMVETMVAKMIPRIFGEESPVPLSGVAPDDKDRQDPSHLNLDILGLQYIQ